MTTSFCMCFFNFAWQTLHLLPKICDSQSCTALPHWPVLWPEGVLASRFDCELACKCSSKGFALSSTENRIQCFLTTLSCTPVFTFIQLYVSCMTPKAYVQACWSVTTVESFFNRSFVQGAKLKKAVLRSMQVKYLISRIVSVQVLILWEGTCLASSILP